MISLVFRRSIALALAVIVVNASAAQDRCQGTDRAGDRRPVPADPYPVMAAGWGPELGAGLMASRWAEDWSGLAAVAQAPSLKGMSVGQDGNLTFSSELRLRHVGHHNAQLQGRGNTQQTQLRAVFGADLRLTPEWRLYTEVGTAQVAGQRAVAKPNFQNRASLQQVFVEGRMMTGAVLLGAMLGRQEFSDGPRQLISLSDGPNQHRSWNGLRLYAHGKRQRWGAYELRGTQLGGAGFDERIDSGERLRGLNASFIVSDGTGPNTYFDPFWIESRQPALRVAEQLGPDHRHSLGARLWGRRGDVRFDWTLVRQFGNGAGESIDAWALFAAQSFPLSSGPWKPRFTTRVDIASGARKHGFNPLYASSNYFSEAQFLSLRNLRAFTPGLAMSPSAARTNGSSGPSVSPLRCRSVS